jgi:predicted nucleotidyltransferase
MDILNSENLNKLISERLAVLNSFKVILFGSCARGSVDANSDIDLLVVLNVEGYPRSFKERMENHRKVRRLLKDLNATVPIDVLVFTIDEWRDFLKEGSSFAAEVVNNGKAIA